MRVLFLSTWFPYPPDQGSKIRAYQLLSSLAAAHEVALVSFQDTALRPAWVDHVSALCRQVEVVERPPFVAPDPGRWREFLSRTPRAVVAGYSPEMEARVRQVGESFRPDVVVALTFVMAPYGLSVVARRRVVDVDNLLANMLYEEIRQEPNWLRRPRRFLAYRKFRAYERRVFRRYDLCLVTSQQDVGRLARAASLRMDQVALVPNGVDLAYYRPRQSDPDPSQLVFNGALTYAPNLDAMEFFIRRIFPRILAERSDARLLITGRTGGATLPSPDITDRVTLTGYVDDIRPIVAGSTACVVPLRKGAGTRLKVLEAMALGTPVVSTPKGVEGLETVAGKHVLVADEAELFARHTVGLLRDASLGRRLTADALELVRRTYDWAGIGATFRGLVEEAGN